MRARSFPDLSDQQLPTNATFVSQEEATPTETAQSPVEEQIVEQTLESEAKAQEEPSIDVAALKNPLHGRKRPKRKWETTADIPKEQIEAWKKQHGPIYKSKFVNDEFIITRVPRRVYKEGMSLSVGSKTENEIQQETMDERNERIYKRQEFFAKNVIIWPEDFEWLLVENAGYAASISDEAILRSGFEIPETEEM